VTGIPIRRELDLNALEFGLLTSTPVLTGALFRLPLGIWTDRFGGRIVMFLLLIFCAVPVWVSSYASQLWQFLLLGLALGLVGASFAVGTPYVARLFPKERRGLAMGVFGAGTTGAAINMFIAPPIPTMCPQSVEQARATLASLADIDGPPSFIVEDIHANLISKINDLSASSAFERALTISSSPEDGIATPHDAVILDYGPDALPPFPPRHGSSPRLQDYVSLLREALVSVT